MRLFSSDKKGVDEWFSVFANRDVVECMIANDSSILKIVDCTPVNPDWKWSRYRENNQLVVREWGTNYPISSQKYPITFLLDYSFKTQLEIFMNEMVVEDPAGTAFTVMLENAYIEYVNIMGNTTKPV
jgi:hypothetical protein